MRVFSLALSTALALAFSAAPVQSQAQTAPPLEDFFKNPRLGGVRLSPDGKHVALIAPSTKGDGRMVLASAPVESPQKWTVVAHVEGADVRSAHWVNDRRLVFDLVDRQAPVGDQQGAGLYAVNLDGTDFVWLVGRRYGDREIPNSLKRPLGFNHVLAGTLADGSDDVLVVRFEERRYETEPTTSVMLRLNTVTKAQKNLSGDDVPLGAMSWLVNRSATHTPVTTTVADGQSRVLYRATPGEPWGELAKFDAYMGGPKAFEPSFMDREGQLYVTASRDDSMKTTALFRYDLKKKEREKEPILALQGYDFTGAPMFDRDDGRLLGLSNTTDASGIAWLDSTMKSVQDKVDALLPHTNNILDCKKCVNGRYVLVHAYSDRQPSVYFLFDRETQKLNMVGASRPWIDSRAMAEQDLSFVKTRDGLNMPVLVTKPKGKGPWPAVILVHGGPYVRGSEWGWTSDSQFLASRGYLVVEPEFRGSTGFGTEYFRKGWKQWGLAMQDDVTDATQWAVQKGLADPKRLVIAGASYGGYATMMGLVKEPELYRAGINWVGVTDIELMYEVGWSDFAGSDWQRFGMPRLVGDRKADKQQLDATSPLKHAARITKPVLMAYGGEDYRVPLPHGTKMRDALKKLGKVPVEWVEYQDEGHGWMLETNNYDFWKRVEAFLAKHAN